ncbi:MAG: pyridoxal-phosphate dependent enzyme [Actinomycetota bacterium]
MFTADHVATAAARISPHARHTPVELSAPMTERVGSPIAVKAEHRQRTGSFKLRGALNKVLSLDPATAEGGIVTASSGNHGIATATAAGIAGVACTVYLPTGASPAKSAAIARAGARIEVVDSTDAFQAEVAARAEAESSGRTYISPYNDPEVAAGQGTIGVELLDDVTALGWDRPDAVVAAVGGGGLISGIATWVKANSPETVIVGASPTVDAAMVASVAAGTVVEVAAEPTFSDGTAGGMEPGSITLDVCRALVDEWLTTDEVDIARAVAAMVDDHHELVEGAAGVALAAAERYGAANPGARIVVVTCGANVSSARLAEMLAVVAAADDTDGPG